MAHTNAVTRDPNVPYDRLDEATSHARRVFPDATSIEPVWAPANDDEILVTVYGLVETDPRVGLVYAYTNHGV